MAWSSQKLAFLACPGHALALAGPGAGKTHVALVKAQQQVASGSLKPSQKVLFLSFARPTVARILEKAAELISPQELKHVEINTYHGFAWSILRSHGYLLNTTRAITLLPPPEAAAHFADVDADARDQEMLRLSKKRGNCTSTCSLGWSHSFSSAATDWWASTATPIRRSFSTSSRTPMPMSGR